MMTKGAGTWVNNQPQQHLKLWRGLALVGAIHIGGMLINIIFQMMGTTAWTAFRPNSSAFDHQSQAQSTFISPC